MAENRAFVVECLYCGKEFRTANHRRLYCCDRCRRKYQDESRKAIRAEEREARIALQWDYDPWERNDLDNIENLYPNALLDGWTATRCGLTMCPDEAVAGAMACLYCERYKGEANDRPFLYGQTFSSSDDGTHGETLGEDMSDGIGEDVRKTRAKPPYKKEVARAMRRRKKRIEARAKPERK